MRGLKRARFSYKSGAKFSPQTKGVKTGIVMIEESASSKPQVIELSGTGT
jgi:hypothetical protein